MGKVARQAAHLKEREVLQRQLARTDRDLVTSREQTVSHSNEQARLRQRLDELVKVNTAVHDELNQAKLDLAAASTRTHDLSAEATLHKNDAIEVRVELDFIMNRAAKYEKNNAASSLRIKDLQSQNAAL